MKVLIISHNPITTYQNMGRTMLSLFFSFKKEELCQLYIYPTIPDIDYCSSYFRITDKDVLKSYTHFFKANGTQIDKSKICSDNKMFVNEEDRQIYHNRKNKTALRTLARDIMWKCTGWYSHALKEWLREEKPECIFLAPGSAKFLYDITLKISKACSIPIVTYICDDYYFLKDPSDVLGKLRSSMFRKKLRATLSRTSHLITICDEIKSCYVSEFSVDATTIMTGTNYEIAPSAKKREEPKSLTYLGNIRCERFTALADIGRALDEINAEQSTDYKLIIYSAEADRTILSSFDDIKAIDFRGYVSGASFDKAFAESEILLHTEAFSEKSMDLVKHSVSTKIADSLASGIPFFAYGPECVSSMAHLLRHNCAVNAVTRESLKDALMTVFTDETARSEAVENALSAARKYHDKAVNSQKLYEILENTIKS